MELLGELLVEFLTGLADFDERKYPPFSPRYWLGWLGILTNLLMLSFLVFVTLVFLWMFAEGRGWSFLVLVLLFMPMLFFWLYKTLGFIRKMWHVTLYYRKISKNIS